MKGYKKEKEVAANQNIKERDYWLAKLSGLRHHTIFPYDSRPTGPHRQQRPGFQTENFRLTGELVETLIKVSKGTDHTLHVILAAVLVELLARYNGSTDIVICSPIYKQKKDPASETEFINTVLPLRIQRETGSTFKTLLVNMRQTTREAVENRNYPIEILEKRIFKTSPGTDFFLFDIALLLENIHDRRYINHIPLNMIFSFLRTGVDLAGVLEYNPLLYEKPTVKGIIRHFIHLTEQVLLNPDLPLFSVDILLEDEKRQLLFEFNDTGVDYPLNQTIHELIERQAVKTPDHIAVVGRARGAEGVALTYGKLNEQSGRLASVLQSKGIGPDTITAVTAERTVDMITRIFGILKAGGAYLPIDPEYPQERINYMFSDSGAKVLIKKSEIRISKSETIQMTETCLMFPLF